MKAYLAGPMSGIDEFNYPMFHDAAAFLRKTHWKIVSPAEQGYPQCEYGTPEYFKCLEGCLELLGDPSLSAIVMLQGWSKSSGAKRELDLAVDLGLKVFFMIKSDVSEFWHVIDIT